MGTDRTIKHQGPCQCGQGLFIIEYCFPDHGWPGSERDWYESRIECAECISIYNIEQRSKNFVLVEKRKSQESDEFRRKLDERYKALMQTEDVVQLLNQLEQLLKDQRSVAATFRLLHDAGLTAHSTEGTFRNHWRNPREWIKENIDAKSLPKIIALLNLSLPSVTNALAEIRALPRPPANPSVAVGLPIYALS